MTREALEKFIEEGLDVFEETGIVSVLEYTARVVGSLLVGETGKHKDIIPKNIATKINSMYERREAQGYVPPALAGIKHIVDISKKFH